MQSLMRGSAALGWVLALGCRQEAAEGPRRRPHVAPPDVAEPAPDAGTGRCVRRVSAPEDIALGPTVSAPRLAWNGAHFGLVWTETIDEEDAVRFVRADTDGARLGLPLRVSERRFLASNPSLTWNGDSWSVLFSGGVRLTGDLYQARVDARGSAVGRPWRMTRGPAHDAEPEFIATGLGFGLAWTTLESTGRWSVYAEVLNRWDAPVAPPTMLFNTSFRLLSPRLLWTGSAWAIAFLSARREASGVHLARMEANGLPRGSVSRITPDRLGGTETAQRFDIAWDGDGFGVVWSELRDGTPQLFFRRVTPRGNPVGALFSLRIADEQSENPSLAFLGDGVYALAEQVVRDGFPRVRVRTLTADGRIQAEGVELRGVDGAAARPALLYNGTVLGLATRSQRGLAFHIVHLGPCATAPSALAPATAPGE